MLNSTQAFFKRNRVRLLLVQLCLAFASISSAQNSALSFNGTSSYVSTSAYLVPTSGDFTVELWVYPTAGGLRHFVSQGQSGSAFFIGMNASSNIWLGDSWPATSIAMPMNEWTHLAVVKSGTNGTLYVNGVQSATTASYSVGTGGTAFYIGKQYGGINEYTQGSIDEVRVWNTARTASQVKSGMYGSVPVNSSNLVAYYQMNEGSGTTVANKSTSTSAAASSDGTLVSGSWLANSPVRAAENGLHFDGVDDHFKTATSTDYESASATVECWVRTEQLSGNACILGYRSATTRYSFHMNATTIGMWNGSGYSTISHTFNPGQWYHLAFVMTASSTEVFVNGVSIGTTGNVRSNVTGVEFFVGVAMSNTLTIMEPFKGVIDDVRVWNVARTATQIQNNMLTDLTGTETNLVRYWNLNQGISGGTNTGLLKAIDLTTANAHGRLQNFALSGNTSNWISHSTAVLNPPPVITSFSPSAAVSGTSVTISGNNFNTTAANNIVYFGGTRATVTAASTTSLTVTVPAGSTYKPISVTNTAFGLTGYSQSPFIATFTGGSGSITFSTAFGLTAGSGPAGVEAEDIDGDGKNDLIVANNNDASVSVFRNIHSSGVIQASSFAAKADYTTLATPSAIALGDLDGDGKKDLVVLNSGAGSLSVFRNTSTSGTISFAARVDFSFAANGRSLTLADLNNDGHAEVIVGANGALYVYPNNATAGSFNTSSLGSILSVRSSGGEFMVTAKDIDGDGKTDLVGTEFTGAQADLFIMRNIHTTGSLSAGSFAAAVTFAVTSTTNTFGAPATGDLDGDGKADIVVANPVENNVWVYRNISVQGSISTGSLASPVKFTTATTPTTVGLADLNGDGKIDIFTSNKGSNNVSTFHNLSSAGTISSSSFSLKRDFATANEDISLVAADLDSDGKAELIVSASSAATLSVLPNTSSAVILPLRFISIQGRQAETDVILDWRTAEEAGTDRFDIERSADGRQFVLAGVVRAENTPGEHHYSFTDRNVLTTASAVIYYRIKQHDLNGNFAYSTLIMLDKQAGASKITLYPNPVVDRINVSLTVPVPQRVVLRIFDNKGSLVRTNEFNLPAGGNSLYLDASGFTKGIYYLQVRGVSVDEQIRFVK